MIDLATIQSLELIQNVQNSKSKDCLFGLMNETLTPMGSRLLRSSILQPSTQADVLNQRYDALEELINKETLFFQSRKGGKPGLPVDRDLLTQVQALKTIHDVEKLLTGAS